MKKVVIGLWGILQGVIGTIWNLFALTFILHPGSAPGTKEWEEDAMFIPIGYVMLVIWLVVMFFSYYKLRKRKNDIIVFSLALIVSMIIFIFGVKMLR